LSPNAIVTILILATAVVALIAGRWRPDLVALGVVLALAIGGVVPANQAFSGFGTPTVAAVAAVFVVSAGLERTGAAALVARRLRRLATGSPVVLLASLMVATGVLSGFMNNLAAAAMLLPVTVALAARSRLSPTLLLLPMAYAARFGGNLTLIAGPSNLLMAEILHRRGIADLRLFDFLPLGLPMLLVGTAWICLAGRRLLPAHLPEDLLRATRRRTRLVNIYRLSERLFEARIPAGSPLAGRSIEQSEFGRAFGITIVAVVRDGLQLQRPPKDLVLQGGDRLVVEGRLDELLQAEALERLGLELSRDAEISLDSPETGIVEAIVSPRSSHVGRTLRDLNFRYRYGITVLALWRENRPIRTRLAELPLQVGDGLLLQGAWKAIKALRDEPDFIVLEEEFPGEMREERRGPALVALGVMIALTLVGVPVAVATVLAAGIIVTSGGLTVDEVYRLVDWRSIVLLGGMIPLGTALETTGAARVLALAVSNAAAGGPLLALVVLLATAVAIGHFVPSILLPVVLGPVAINLAGALGVSAVPFAMAIIAATGMTILTPFSNPVMLMVMAPGGYSIRDYVRVGLPLVGILFALMLLIIPVAYPFR